MAGRQVDGMEYSEIEENGSDERRESDWEEARDKRPGIRRQLVVKGKKKVTLAQMGRKVRKETTKGRIPKTCHLINCCWGYNIQSVEHAAAAEAASCEVVLGTHSFKALFTITKGITNYSEFAAMCLVDGMVINHYDSKSKQIIPRTEWMKNSLGPDYWKQQTDITVDIEKSFIINIDVVMGRFNQTGGVHSFQWMYGCEVDDDGTKRGYMQYGYDGEDFLCLDKSSLTWTAANPQAVITKVKYDSTGADANVYSDYLDNTCIEWLNKYVDYGKDTLKRKVSPQVFVLQKNSSSPVKCLVTGFYPKEVSITWQRNGQDHYENVDLGELRPNQDGTFQKTSTLRVTADERKNNKFICVVEHQDKTIREILTENSVPIGIIVGVAALILLVVGGVVGFVVYRRKKESSDNS